MASIRDLKKDINYVLGDIIEAVYIWELTADNKDAQKGDAIIDETIEHFDRLIAKVNDKSVENRSKHLSEVNKELEEVANGLVEKLNKLS
ncbi:hypothetical protein E7Z59_13745 [Robertkochia marina]|uniref:Uncharacterized protein n=1 Tax=Robertkochia marina TaxID=1227945 RepID=A0A4S3LX69_9FLAO|nr:hypothetical protein [Robertkochia marina]THD65652.1 hypothetical protein E7Z59_13745 [Robertkochia marina]TRZ46667.1 hypothetical protein D3A96_03620 [Robertkochia marina]